MGWLTVRVLKRGNYGRTWPMEYCKVSGSISGFIGGMTRDFRTDDRGIAELEWSNDNDLKCLYIKGERYDGPFESGRSCTIVVD